ncbi:MAG: glycosyltransferase [Herbiconiux sp.]|uniref:glycosyltransferase family 4 protein n=1 Tax=Herbiconiux sp. TaxID=1871186 RepID=UPI00120EF018|nr:glycosyltransferase family 4 protein [Herbiconiux sp.]TAJ49305.1 MAG: glycosyltransferase [Herbiconiux sp.]
MKKRYDVVMALNYYAPYVSGLTEAARVVAESMAAEGKKVLVVTCRHDSTLPTREVVNGVMVHRTPVVARIGKGLISPLFVPAAIRFGRMAHVVNLHLPMIESGPISVGLRGVPIVLTYQCDISLPPSVFNRLQSTVMDWSNAIAMRLSSAIAPSSDDYARASRLAALIVPPKEVPISPPTRLRDGGKPSFRRGDGMHVGFLGRLVEEKGLEYLVEGFRKFDDPEARLLIGGDYLKVAGGSVVEKVRAAMGNDTRIELLGFLADDQLDDFYASLDVFALPSVNSFEAFGIVQVEAMKVGVAALASDLPGVRTPVRNTGFGVVVARKNSGAITEGLRELAASPPDRIAGAAAANHWYSDEITTREYSELFDRVRADGK